MSEIIKVLEFIIGNLLRVWPILVVTVPISIMVRHFDSQKRIKSLLTSKWIVSVLIATAVGAIAPFCSCSIIPVIAGLIGAGVPIAPIMAFWLASPSMDPEIFLLSTASLGVNLAIARVIATGLMSILGGIAAHYLIDLKRDAKKGFYTVQAPAKKTGKELRKEILKESLQTFWMLFKFLVLAFTLEAIIVYYVPNEWVMSLFGTGTSSILKATLISIPLYTTNLSALGIVSGLMTKGLSEGAALSFLIGGATTTIPAMAAVYKIVDRKIFMLYVLLATSSAFLAGIIFNLI
jgi:uncharacterized membrane protein YraQ (UPF0718 family)